MPPLHARLHAGRAPKIGQNSFGHSLITTSVELSEVGNV
jgi:hypothetical protein